MYLIYSIGVKLVQSDISLRPIFWPPQ